MRCLVTQSNYLPWRGYFANLAEVDVAIFLDSAQYTKRDWRNRNRIRKGPESNSSKWLTISLEGGGSQTQRINEVKILDKSWAENHWNQIESSYGKFEFFSDLLELEPYIKSFSNDFTLSRVNQKLIHFFCKKLEIEVEFLKEPFVEDAASPSEKICRIVREIQARQYVSAPAARDYLDTDLFKSSGIEVIFTDYSKLPNDTEGFEFGVGEYSIIDLVARKGWGGASSFCRFQK